MMIKNLIEPENGKMCDEQLKVMDSNGNFAGYSDKNTITKVTLNADVNRIVKKEHYTEDKTSDDYVPKSYRSQGWINRTLTGILSYFGFTFLQPIKWKNVLPIFIIHIICFYMLIAFPVFEIKPMTILWGKSCNQLP